MYPYSAIRETKISGANGNREIFVFPLADHEKDRQPYPVDPYSAICDDHILQGCVTRAIILK